MTNNTQPKPRLPGLDLLRAIAITLVFIFHCPTFNGQPIINFFYQSGWVGVDLFFVLSGFLIADPLFSRLAQQKTFSLKTFYIRRFMRTFPCYFVVLALYFLLPGFSERPIIAPLWQFLTFTQNMDLVVSGYSQSWSLCIEEQFYLLFPIIILFFCAKRTRRQSAMLIGAILLAGILLRAVFWFVFVEYAGENAIEQYFNKIYYLTFTHLDGLLLGVAVALIKNFYVATWEKLTAYGNWLLAAGLIGTFITLYFLLDRLAFAQVTLGFSLLAFNFALLIIAALSPSSILYSLKIPGAASLAKWSYAIYLTHKQFIAITSKVLTDNHVPYSFFFYTGKIILICLVGGWLLYFLVEKPFMWWRGRITDKYIARNDGSRG